VTEVVIVDGVRTPIARGGKDKSYYKDIRAAALGALCMKKLHRDGPGRRHGG
jgi:acetyl-CoA acetyltransferase